MKKKYYLGFILIALGLFSTYAIGRVVLCNYIDKLMDQHVPSSTIPVDVVLVASVKDFELVPYSVESVRKYLKQPINRTVLIAPKTNEALKLAQDLHMKFIDEDQLLSLSDFKTWVEENNLSHNNPKLTWYYQQFLKLMYAKLSNSDYYFMIDSDIVMNRPFTVVTDDKIHSFFVGENKAHKVSSISIRKLLGEEQYIPEFSYIADLMCFNKKITQNLLKVIEKRSGTEFYKAAMLAEQNSTAVFSEYELYGVFANHSKEQNHQLINYIPSVYANNEYFKNYLSSYHFLSNGHTRKRYSLLWDRYDPTLKAYPYVAYHSWVEHYKPT